MRSGALSRPRYWEAAKYRIQVGIRTAKKMGQENRARVFTPGALRGSLAGTAGGLFVTSAKLMGSLHTTQTRTLGESICPQAGQAKGSAGNAKSRRVAAVSAWLGSGTLLGSLTNSPNHSMTQWLIHLITRSLKGSRSIPRAPASRSPGVSLPSLGADRSCACSLPPGLRPATGRTTTPPAPRP